VVFSQAGTTGTSGPGRSEGAGLYFVCDVRDGPRVDLTSKLNLHSQLDDFESSYSVSWDGLPPEGEGSVESWKATVVGAIGSDLSTHVDVPRSEWGWLIEGLMAHTKLELRVERRDGPDSFVVLDFPADGFSEAFGRLDCFEPPAGSGSASAERAEGTPLRR